MPRRALITGITGEQLTHLVRPDEIYHLGAQSHVKVSFDMPEYTGDITGLGVTRLLEAIRRSGIRTRVYQASSSEMFGEAPPPQNEATTFRSREPVRVQGDADPGLTGLTPTGDEARVGQAT